MARTLRVVTQDDLDDLSQLYGQVRLLEIAARLRSAGSQQTLRKFQSFIKSLDGAIRHGQRCRDSRETAQ